MKALASIGIVLFGAACARAPAAERSESTVAVPKPESTTAAAEPETTSAPASNAAERPRMLARSEWRDGAKTAARGRYSKTPWQHMMGGVPGKKPEYFDLEDRHQTVIYIDQPIQCADLVEVVGTVMEVSGPA